MCAICSYDKSVHNKNTEVKIAAPEYEFEVTMLPDISLKVKEVNRLSHASLTEIPRAVA